MKYQCGCEDNRPAISNKGEPLSDDYVDYVCYDCKTNPAKYYFRPHLSKAAIDRAVNTVVGMAKVWDKTRKEVKP